MHFDNRSEWGENTSQQGRVYDFSGEGNNGTLGNETAGTAPTWNATGKLAGAFEFDGSDDYVDCNNSHLNITGDQMTIAAWIYMKGGDSRRTIATKWGGYFFELSPNDLSVWLYGTSNEGWHQSAGTVGLNTWTHAAFTYNGSNVLFYINGNQDPNTPSTAGNIDQIMDKNVYIGCVDEEGQSRDFQGTIDEVAIWNRSLTADEILDLYRLGEGKYYWSANASDGFGGEAWNGTNEFNIGNALPTITLNAPENQSYTSNNYAILNITVIDLSSPEMTPQTSTPGTVSFTTRKTSPQALT
jgi:hypothetical protein